MTALEEEHELLGRLPALLLRRSRWRGRGRMLVEAGLAHVVVGQLLAVAAFPELQSERKPFQLSDRLNKEVRATLVVCPYRNWK